MLYLTSYYIYLHDTSIQDESSFDQFCSLFYRYAVNCFPVAMSKIYIVVLYFFILCYFNLF